jgi:hypothetical protein
LKRHKRELEVRAARARADQEEEAQLDDELSGSGAAPRRTAVVRGGEKRRPLPNKSASRSPQKNTKQSSDCKKGVPEATFAWSIRTISTWAEKWRN